MYTPKAIPQAYTQKHKKMEAVTITVDQKWVDELIKRLDKYHMFQDRDQKIWEMVKTTAKDEIAMKEKRITQTMVEGWCRENKVKLVEAKNLEFKGPDGRNTNWRECPALWINPYDKYSGMQGYDLEKGVCPSHAQCWECSKCIDPMEGGIWGKDGENTCSACRSKYKIKGLFPGKGPEIDVNRPVFDKIPSAKKKFFREDIAAGVLEKYSHDQLKRTAAENGLSSSGTKEELIYRLYEYLDLHGRFKRDLPKLKAEVPKTKVLTKAIAPLKVEKKAGVSKTKIPVAVAKKEKKEVTPNVAPPKAVLSKKTISKSSKKVEKKRK